MTNFPPIYIINLKKSTDRIENVKKVMDKYNLKFNRFDAVYGKELSEDQINKNTNIICRTLLCNNGIIGCAMSHIQLWNKLLEDKNNDKYLILEDDIHDIDIEQLNSLFNFINKNNFDYDFISLNCVSMFCQNLNKGIKVNEKLYLTNKLFTMGTGGYIINKNGAKKLVDMFNKYKISYHIDISIAIKKLISHNLKHYNTNFNLVKLNEITTLNSTISKSHNSILLFILDKLKLYEIEWNLKVPLFTLFRKLQISLYFCILTTLLILNIKKFKIKYVNYFIILEMILLIITQL
jgi:glycosyl transferase family 25